MVKENILQKIVIYVKNRLVERFLWYVGHP